MTNIHPHNIEPRMIRIEVKSIYGRMRAYPVCMAATSFAKIAGTKTLSREVLRSIAELGYSINVESPNARTSFAYPDSKDVSMHYSIDL